MEQKIKSSGRETDQRELPTKAQEERAAAFEAELKRELELKFRKTTGENISEEFREKEPQATKDKRKKNDPEEPAKYDPQAPKKEPKRKDPEFPGGKKERREKGKIRRFIGGFFKSTGALVCVLAGTLAMFVFRGIFWMLKTWSNLTMEELMFHLESPLDGTNTGMIRDFIYSCAVPALITTVVLIVLFVLLRKRKILFPVSLTFVLFLSAATIGLTVSHLWNTLDISTYNSDKSTYSTFIDDNYVAPQDVTITFPEEKRNLIYIFLESVEMTYSDEESGGAFEKDVIPELTELSLQNENFSGEEQILNGGHVLKGCTWTVGGMFGQTSGLPLLIPISSNKMNTQDTFFPSIATLGDILASAGYAQSLLIGSDADFGGRQLYFTEHGKYSIWDYYYFSQKGYLPEGYRVWWGYEDAYLFEFAKEKVTEMSQGDQPFNLTLLTVDTHFEDGYVCEDCPETFGDNQYSNVMACSSKKVAEFIKWLQQQDFYDNTTIILCGDHCTMDSDYCNNVDEDYERKVYTAVINSAVTPQTQDYREYTTLDMFPTTLASLGVEIEGNRLGLGTNLFSSTQTLAERFGCDTINAELGKNSRVMEKLTADIDPQKVEVQEEAKEEEKPAVPQAELFVTPYDFTTGKFEVQIHFLSGQEEVQTVMCAVWSHDDQSNIRWYEAETAEDGSCHADIWASDFFYEPGTYQIHVYAVCTSGDRELICAGEETMK